MCPSESPFIHLSVRMSVSHALTFWETYFLSKILTKKHELRRVFSFYEPTQLRPKMTLRRATTVTGIPLHSSLIARRQSTQESIIDEIKKEEATPAWKMHRHSLIVVSQPLCISRSLKEVVWHLCLSVRLSALCYFWTTQNVFSYITMTTKLITGHS